MSVIQAISFYKPQWSLSSAKKYIKGLKVKPIKPAHETKGMLHFRLEDPSDFDRFTSEKFDKEGILLTVGHVAQGGAMECNNCLGRREHTNQAVAIDDELHLKPYGSDTSQAILNPLQQVFPLSNGSDILDHPVIKDQKREKFKDQVTVKDMRSDVINNVKDKDLKDDTFRPGTMIYEMLRPVSEGGIGFPFPTSASIFSPTLSQYHK